MARGKVHTFISIWKAKRKVKRRMGRRGWLDSMTPEEQAAEIGRWVSKGSTQCRCDYCYPHVGGMPDHHDKRADADMREQLADLDRVKTAEEWIRGVLEGVRDDDYDWVTYYNSQRPVRK